MHGNLTPRNVHIALNEDQSLTAAISISKILNAQLGIQADSSSDSLKWVKNN